MLRREEGFTLTEMAVVMMILAVLVLVAIASFSVNSERSNRVACLSNQRMLTGAIATYQLANDGQSPDSLDDLEPYVRSYSNASHCPSDGRLLVFDLAGVVLCTHPGHTN